MIELTFLGTTCMVPTKDRNHQGLFLRYKNEGLLFDCGEGIQRQFKIAGIKLTKVTRILISHWHGDHVLGLPGFIQSMAASDYEGTLEIYGPIGIKARMKSMMETFLFDRTLPLKVTEVKDGTIIDTKEFSISCGNLEHGIPTLGYTFIEKDRRRIKMPELKKLGVPEGPHIATLQEGKDIVYEGKKVKSTDTTYLVKGKKVTILSDTFVCKACYDLAKDADLLVCEASFTSEHEEKATEYKHMTAEQAGLLASRSEVTRLVLTHFSPRYKDVSVIEDDAKKVFENVTLAYDFLKMKV